MRGESVKRVGLDEAPHELVVRETPPKVSNVRTDPLQGIVWVGVVLFLFGLGTLFYPPLRAIIGSVTTSAAILVGGLVLMVLPTLVVGNELMILGGVTLAVGGWFVAYRYGQMRGLVDAAKNNLETK